MRSHCRSDSCRSLLKGPHPQADFRNDGHAHSEHQCWFGCMQGTSGTYGETLLEWGLRWDSLCTEVPTVSIIPCWALPPTSAWTQYHHSREIIKLDNRGRSTQRILWNPTSPTHGPTQAISRYILSKSGAPCWAAPILTLEAADLDFWCGLLKQL